MSLPFRLDLAVAALVLIPYAGLFVPFQTGLVLQAGLICILLGLVAVGGDLGVSNLVSSLPSRIAWGLGLYAAAALWGAAVGLVSGNPLRYVTSQFLAMVLLPLGFLAFARSSRLRGRTIVRGFAVASWVALTIHLVAMFFPALQGEDGGGARFLLRNNVAITGATVLMFLLLLVFATRRKTERTGLSSSGLAAAGILLLGGLSRGAWLATALGIGILLVLHAEGRKRLALWAGGAVVVLGVVIGAAAIPVLESGPVILERGFEDGVKPDRYLLVDPAECWDGATCVHLRSDSDTWRTPLAWNVPAQHRTLVIRGWTRGEADHRLSSTVTFLDDDLAEIGRQQRLIAGTGRWSEFRWLVTVPEQARVFRVWAGAGKGQGSWLIDGIVIRGVESAAASGLTQVVWRLSSLVRHGSDPAIDGGLSYRLRELGSVLSEWRRASPLRVIMGQGLGAMFEFENYTWTPDGRQVTVPEASYIHNFYLFLGFKLGIAGAAALGGLLLLASWIVGRVLRGRDRGGLIWLPAGVGAAWGAYLAWGVTSPEIYNFRVAPIWGTVLAACWMETRSRSLHVDRS